MPDVFANNRSILHKGDGLSHVSGPPDVCKTPSPGGPVPIPYPNIAQDSNLSKGTKKVKINGKSVATKAANLSTSTGDEPGTAGGGILSSKTKGKLTWGSASTDVKAEGNGVTRFMDVTQHNGNVWNTVITALGAVTTPGYGDDPIDQPDCPICTEPTEKHRVEADASIVTIAQDLRRRLENPSGPFAQAFKKPSGNPLKPSVMIGALVCQCEEEKKYAGLSGTAFVDPAWVNSRNAFDAEATALGLTPCADVPSGPPRSGNFPGQPFGRMSSQQWADAQARAATTQQTHGGANAVLTCAAPKMIQKCLEDGHKPGQMVEMLMVLRPPRTITIPWHLHVTVDHTQDPPVRTETTDPAVFPGGEPVPSCITCQVVLTTMLCNTGQPPCP